jgi:hypothetical protein
MPRRCATDAQRQARLNELAEAKRQLNKELAILHQELGSDPEHRDRQPAQEIPRSSPVRGTASGGSTAEPLNSPEPEHRRRRPGDEHTTTTDAPTRALTSTPTPMLMPRHSLGGRRRTLLRQPCCCVAVRRQRPPRRDGCVST